MSLVSFHYSLRTPPTDLFQKQSYTSHMIFFVFFLIMRYEDEQFEESELNPTVRFARLCNALAISVRLRCKPGEGNPKNPGQC